MTNAVEAGVHGLYTAGGHVLPISLTASGEPHFTIPRKGDELSVWPSVNLL